MTMDQVSYFMVLILLIGTCLKLSEAQYDTNDTSTGLKCYFCADTGVDNRCEDFDTYKIAMDNEGNHDIKKVCEYPFNVSCAIETYQTVSGGTAAHIRDCSDGSSFAFTSFDLSVKGAYDKLINATESKNNITSCVWDGNNLICLSQCATNYCNGPRLKEVTDSSNQLIPGYYMFLLLIINILINK
ncbi:hypothetical protein ACF0H5_019297 [Mactra antiquata]